MGFYLKVVAQKKFLPQLHFFITKKYLLPKIFSFINEQTKKTKKITQLYIFSIGHSHNCERDQLFILIPLLIFKSFKSLKYKFLSRKLHLDLTPDPSPKT